MGKRKAAARLRATASHSPIKDTVKKARVKKEIIPSKEIILSSDRLAELSKSLSPLDDKFAETLRNFKAAYRVISKLHEPICPVGSDEHSITGNITAGSFGKLASILQNEVPEEYKLKQDSIYLDIGR